VTHHRGTMVVLAGVMIGALRSLWPWQSEAGALHAPGADWPLLLGLAVAGVLAVQLLVLVESRTVTRAEARAAAAAAGGPGHEGPAPESPGHEGPANGAGADPAGPLGR